MTPKTYAQLTGDILAAEEEVYKLTDQLVLAQRKLDEARNALQEFYTEQEKQADDWRADLDTYYDIRTGG